MKINGIDFIEKVVRIQQPNGIHCRPSAYIAQLIGLAKNGDVFISKENQAPEELKASIFHIMNLEILQGEKIKLFFAQNFPQKLLDTILDCFSAKTVYDCEKTAEKYFEAIHKNFHPFL